MNNPKFNFLLDKMKETHDRKNSDYSNGLDPYSNFQYAAMVADIPRYKVYLVLLAVKAARLNELLGKKEPINESINDTLLDFAVYATLMASDLIE